MGESNNPKRHLLAEIEQLRAELASAEQTKEQRTAELYNWTWLNSLVVRLDRATCLASLSVRVKFQSYWRVILLFEEDLIVALKPLSPNQTTLNRLFTKQVSIFTPETQHPFFPKIGLKTHIDK